VKIISRYIFHDFVVAFLISLLVITVVISLTFIFKIADLIALGIPMEPAVTMLVASIPTSLRLSIPVSALVSCLLIFGRLSADGEITAMRTSGVRIWSACRGTLLAGVLLTAFCVYNNHFIEPVGHLQRRMALAEARTLFPLELFEEGRFVTLGEFSIYAGKRRDNILQNVRIVQMLGVREKREIHAQRGVIHEADDGKALVVNLSDARVTPFSKDVPETVFMEKWTIKLDDIARRAQYVPDEEDRNLLDLLAQLREIERAGPHENPADAARKRMVLAYTVNQRFVMAASCLAFIVLGIPLGIRSHRKESSIGIGLSLILVFVFYAIVAFTESFVDRPFLRPDLLIWFPVALFGAIGAALMLRWN